MEHFLLIFAEFVLALGAIGVFLVVALVLGLGLAAKAVAQMFSGKPPRKRRPVPKASEVERLRQQLLEAQNTAYESALASEKTIQQLQQRLASLEAAAAPGFISVRP